MKDLLYNAFLKAEIETPQKIDSNKTIEILQNIIEKRMEQIFEEVKEDPLKLDEVRNDFVNLSYFNGLLHVAKSANLEAQEEATRIGQLPENL